MKTSGSKLDMHACDRCVAAAYVSVAMPRSEAINTPSQESQVNSAAALDPRHKEHVRRGSLLRLVLELELRHRSLRFLGASMADGEDAVGT